MKRRRHLLKQGWPLLFLFLAMVLWAAEKSDVTVSTGTVKARRKPLKELRGGVEKVLTPNPRFQGPQQQTLPLNAPVTPKLEPLPPAPEKPSASERFFRAVAKVMTLSWNDNIFVWLPAISTDPNTGPTMGLMPVLVLSDPASHHIRHLLAPSYTFNSLFGQTVTGRYYFYPKDESQLYAVASYSQHTNRELKVRYEDAAWLGGRAFVRAESYYNVNGSMRFFGIGPNTVESDESGYTNTDKVAYGAMGVNFLGKMRASIGVRFRNTGTGRNIIEGIPDLATEFPTVTGVAEQDTVVQEFRLLWDSRDIPATPSTGRSGEMFFEKTTRGWGSDSDFIRYGLDGKRYFTWKGGKQTTVIHGLYDWTNGPNIPFYEMGQLGGRDTLRGYGEGRFTDKGRLLFNIEQRCEITSLALMGVVTKFEVGPFIDLGTVFPTLPKIQGEDFRPVFGGSFRAVVKPNVVGSVDVGIGKEGPGVYVGINYPF